MDRLYITLMVVTNLKYKGGGSSMDFRQNLSMGTNRTDPAPAAPSNNNNPKKDNAVAKALRTPQWMKILSAIVLIGAALLIIGVVFVFARSMTNGDDSKYLKTSKYQAVFLSNGQVYFGQVEALSRSNVVLKDVFYLTQNSTSSTSSTTSSNTDYTLVKLGCQQIHYPDDQMVVSRDQITFWENLSDEGKVVKSIKEFKKQNPKGENCTTSTSTDTQSTNSGTNATQNSSNTTNTNNSTSTGN